MTEKILQRLAAEECQVVLLSRDSKKGGENYYVGVDYYRSGRLAAELLGKMISGGAAGAGKGIETKKIFVPVTTEYRSNQDIHARLNGFLDKIKDFPDCQVLPLPMSWWRMRRFPGRLIPVCRRSRSCAVFLI